MTPIKESFKAIETRQSVDQDTNRGATIADFSERSHVIRRNDLRDHDVRRNSLIDVPSFRIGTGRPEKLRIVTRW